MRYAKLRKQNRSCQSLLVWRLLRKRSCGPHRPARGGHRHPKLNRFRNLSRYRLIRMTPGKARHFELELVQTLTRLQVDPLEEIRARQLLPRCTLCLRDSKRRLVNLRSLRVQLPELDPESDLLLDERRLQRGVIERSRRKTSRSSRSCLRLLLLSLPRRDCPM